MNIKVQWQDFNGVKQLLSDEAAKEWADILKAAEDMPLYLKGSLQKNKSGHLIFDPVATNAYLERVLGSSGWISGPSVPPAVRFLGSDVDFAKNGIMLEAQFSNYPFFLNNVIRSDIFKRAGIKLGHKTVKALVLLTKTGRLPASNSTLYYEQSVEQANGLSKFNMFGIPMRVTNLSVDPGHEVPSVQTIYPDRTSRTIKEQINGLCLVERGSKSTNGWRLTFKRLS